MPASIGKSGIQSDLPANFAGKYVVRESGCWEWTAAKGSRGYGSVCIGDSKTALAHRVAYEALVGPIPEGMTIDHVVCQNKPCINPAHMEVVTREENSFRASGAAPDTPFYPCGHPRTPENTFVKKQHKGAAIMRNCRECRRLKAKQWRDKAKSS